MRKILFQILGFIFVSFLFLLLIMKMMDLSAEAGNQAITELNEATSVDVADSFLIVDDDDADTKNNQITWSNVQGSITKTGTITTGVWNAGAVTSSGSVTASTHTGSGATTYDAGGAAAIVVGSADVTSLTVTTDGTGDGEVVLPNNSIGSSELVSGLSSEWTDIGTYFKQGDVADSGIYIDDADSSDTIIIKALDSGGVIDILGGGTLSILDKTTITQSTNAAALAITGTGNTTQHIVTIDDGASITGASLLLLTGSDSDSNTRELFKVIQGYSRLFNFFSPRSLFTAAN